MRTFKDSYFDCIVAGELIEHLEKPEKFIKECRRTLKKNGRLIITTPNRKSLVNRISGSYETKVHPSLFDYESLGELLGNNGFRIKEASCFPYTEESSYGSRRKWSFALRKAAHRIIPNGLRENMAIIAEKY